MSSKEEGKKIRAFLLQKVELEVADAFSALSGKEFIDTVSQSTFEELCHVFAHLHSTGVNLISDLSGIHAAQTTEIFSSDFGSTDLCPCRWS